MQTLLDTLPTRIQAYLAAATAFVLNQNFPGEKFIWENPFENEKNVFNQLTVQYIEELKMLDEEIKARNSKLKIPYTVLQPSNIPIGVSI